MDLLPTCGTVPTSDGPSRALIGATLQGPATAVSGTTADVHVLLRSLTGHAEQLNSAVPVKVLVASHRKIVGQHVGLVAGGGVRVAVPATGQVPMTHNPTGDATNAYAGQVLLAGCVRGKPDMAKPDASRQPLPAGQYQLVAVLDDGAAAGTRTVLVTSPLLARITAP